MGAAMLCVEGEEEEEADFINRGKNAWVTAS
jgi:hypothetical protein